MFPAVALRFFCHLVGVGGLRGWDWFGVWVGAEFGVGVGIVVGVGVELELRRGWARWGWGWAGVDLGWGWESWD